MDERHEGDHHRHVTDGNPWSAGCVETRTSGAEGGPGKRAGRDPGTAPRSDPYTQIDTDEGPLYLATTEDLFSRRLLGHAMSAHNDAALVVASLQMAVATRGGDVDGVIFHTDRGSEYAASKTAAECRRHGITQSMGRVGCALDNAAAEAFNSTLKVEFVHRHRFTTRAEARIKISTWIADFYSSSRRHRANDGLAPITFERQMAGARRASTAQLKAEVA